MTSVLTFFMKKSQIVSAVWLVMTGISSESFSIIVSSISVILLIENKSTSQPSSSSPHPPAAPKNSSSIKMGITILTRPASHSSITGFFVCLAWFARFMWAVAQIKLWPLSVDLISGQILLAQFLISVILMPSVLKTEL